MRKASTSAGRRRQAGQVERHAADQREPVGLRRRREPLRLQLGQDERVDRVLDPVRVSRDGRNRRAGSAVTNDQCCRSFGVSSGSWYAGSAAEPIGREECEGGEQRRGGPWHRESRTGGAVSIPGYTGRRGGSITPRRTADGSAKMAGTPPVWMKTSTEPGRYRPPRTSAIRAAIAFAV